MNDVRARLEAKYEVLAKLRDGELGPVYKVHHSLLDEFQAVEVLGPDFEVTGEAGERFLEQVRAAIRFHHPNIIQLLDFTFDESSGGWLVMEHAGDRTLDEAPKGPPPLPPTFALDLALQLLSALEALHRSGFVHGSVCPENIVLTRSPDGETVVKLTHPGVAPQRGLGPPSPSAKRTSGLHYTAPEQLRGESPEVHSDLYSLGAVLYELLTGLHPLSGQGDAVDRPLADRQVAGTMLPFSASDPEGRLPKALRVSLAAALAPDPAHRVRSARELHQVLTTVRETLPAAQVSPTLREFLELATPPAHLERAREPPPREAAAAAFTGEASDPASTFEETRKATPEELGKWLQEAEASDQDLGETVAVDVTPPAPEPVPQAGSPSGTTAPLPTGEMPKSARAAPSTTAAAREVLSRGWRAGLGFLGGAASRVRPLAARGWQALSQHSRRLPPLVKRLGSDRRSWLMAAAVVGLLLVLLAVAVGLRALLSSPESSLTEPPAATAAPAIPSQEVVVDATPWGEVIAISGDGTESLGLPGLTPHRLTLPAGQYAITVRGPSGRQQTQTLLVADTSASVLFDFEPDPLPLLEVFALAPSSAGTDGETEPESTPRATEQR